MPLNHLRHQAVHGTARRGNEAQHIAAFRFAVEGTAQGLDLSTNPGDSMGELFLFANRVRHFNKYTLVVYRETRVADLEMTRARVERAQATIGQTAAILSPVLQ
jgi:hypothetical protein